MPIHIWQRLELNICSTFSPHPLLRQISSHMLIFQFCIFKLNIVFKYCNLNYKFLVFMKCFPIAFMTTHFCNYIQCCCGQNTNLKILWKWPVFRRLNYWPLFKVQRRVCWAPKPDLRSAAKCDQNHISYCYKLGRTWSCS
jgi:hypothetical protein